MTRDEAAALLGVTADAPGPDVQRAFLRQARRVHPDVLPEATDAQRREAAVRFDELVRARGVLLDPSGHGGDEASLARPTGAPADGSRGPAVRYGSDAPSRGFGNTMLVLVLLAFLLVALVTLDDALRTHAFESPADSTRPAPAASP